MHFNFLENIYFICALILLLSISDYLLTLKGQKYYRKYARKYIKIESYELNPLWKNSIKKGKYNFRHSIGLFLLLIGVIYLFYSSNIIYEFVVGGLIIGWGSILSLHISNLAIYNFIGKNPGLVQGKIRYKKGFSYFVSIINTFSLMIIIFIILIFNQTLFLLGGFYFSIIFILINYIWYRRALNN